MSGARYSAGMPTPTPQPSLSTLPEAIAAEMPIVRDQLAELVAIPTVADPAQFSPEEGRRGAAWVAAAFRAAGIPDARAVDTIDGTQAVIGLRPGPEGAPTVLLYSHYDVQPPLDEAAWHTPPFTLTTGDDGRWYGRGAADCKGNVVAHLAALRVLGALYGDDWPFGVRLVVEGSEEQAGAGLEDYLRTHPEDFAADAMLIQDGGNLAAGVPTLITELRGAADVVVSVDVFPGAVHSGQYGGAAPDAVAALIRLLDSLRDEAGASVVDGLPATGTWDGGEMAEATLRDEIAIIPGVDVPGGDSIASTLWARPAVTVIGIDVPPVVGSTNAIQGHAAARLNLRVPAGMSADEGAEQLRAHLLAHAPWGAQIAVEVRSTGEGFRTRTDTPAFQALSDAMAEAFGAETQTAGMGGSIPLCAHLQEAYPEAAICLLGVEEPACRIHAPNESVDPDEIRRIATAEALFLTRIANAAPSATEARA